MSIGPRNETTSGTEAAITVTPLAEPRTAHCHWRFTPLFRQSNRSVEWGYTGITALHFQVLGGGTDFWTPSRDVVLLLIYCFPE